MQHCPAKAKSYKKKSGKCGCCCCTRLIKRVPYATISNKTAASDTGAFISFLPDGNVFNLWAAAPAGLNPTTTCINGPLGTLFDAATGLLTIVETGLYEITLTGDWDPATTNLSTQTDLALAVRINYVTLIEPTKRCINGALLPTTRNYSGQPGTAGNLATATTVTAKLVLLQGDVLQFQAIAQLGSGSTPENFMFQIDIVQHSRLDKAKVEAAVFA
uniref:Uncharacterized protein n=1 Tax=Pithovirus LCPAC304 TaxID=2506594 RepID=A0A481ZAQ6_9VIRU|nr:MAG: hypothetical protein LCPAC304_05260 [Pithovirus LCPAC304]